MASHWRLALAIAVPLLLIGTFAVIMVKIWAPTPAPVIVVAENITPVAEIPPPTPAQSPAQQPPDWVKVAEKVKPCVVLIVTETWDKKYYSGSGVILNAEGYILTNKHVVENSKSIVVFLLKGNEIIIDEVAEKPARLIRNHEQGDLAIIKISSVGCNLKAIEIGDSSALKSGQPILVIGYPLVEYFYDKALSTIGEPTNTTGIVSALHRKGKNGESAIQIDAAVNFGNSGGALMDSGGFLVGIPTLKYGDAQNINLAISIDYAKPFIASVLGE